MQCLSCGADAAVLALLPETPDGRRAARALTNNFNRLRRLCADGRIAPVFPTLRPRTLTALSPEEIASRLADAGLDHLPSAPIPEAIRRAT